MWFGIDVIAVELFRAVGQADTNGLARRSSVTVSAAHCGHVAPPCGWHAFRSTSRSASHFYESLWHDTVPGCFSSRVHQSPAVMWNDTSGEGTRTGKQAGRPPQCSQKAEAAGLTTYD